MFSEDCEIIVQWWKNELCLRAFLVEEQNFICSFNSAITISHLNHMACHGHIHEISEPGQKICQCFHWSTFSTGHKCIQEQTDGAHAKDFRLSAQKQWREKKVGRKTKGNCKDFCIIRKHNNFPVFFPGFYHPTNIYALKLKFLIAVVELNSPTFSWFGTNGTKTFEK